MDGSVIIIEDDDDQYVEILGSETYTQVRANVQAQGEVANSLVCPVINCNIKFTDQQAKARHTEQFLHSPCNPFILTPDGTIGDDHDQYCCLECQGIFKDRGTYDRHRQRRSHVQFEGPTIIRGYACPLCLLLFVDFQSCSDHISSMNHKQYKFPFADDFLNEEPEPVPMPLKLLDEYVRRCRLVDWTMECVGCGEQIPTIEDYDKHRKRATCSQMIMVTSKSNVADVFAYFVKDSACSHCHGLIDQIEDTVFGSPILCNNQKNAVIVQNDCRSFASLVVRCALPDLTHTIIDISNDIDIIADDFEFNVSLMDDKETVTEETRTVTIAEKQKANLTINIRQNNSDDSNQLIPSKGESDRAKFVRINPSYTGKSASTPILRVPPMHVVPPSCQGTNLQANRKRTRWDDPHVRRKIDSQQPNKIRNTKESPPAINKQTACPVPLYTQQIPKGGIGSNYVATVNHVQQNIPRGGIGSRFVGGLVQNQNMQHQKKTPLIPNTVFSSVPNFQWLNQIQQQRFVFRAQPQQPQFQQFHRQHLTNRYQHYNRYRNGNNFNYRNRGPPRESRSNVFNLDNSMATSVKEPENLEQMKHIVFLDIDNWLNFFGHLPGRLPDKTFVWGFYGGKTTWMEPRHEAYHYMKKNGWFHLHGKCGSSKDAADFALVLTVGRMDERLPKQIPFTIVSGDRGFCELERQMAASKRRAVVVNPHRETEDMIYSLIKSVPET